MEIFFGRLKTEMFYGLEKTYTSFEIFAKAILNTLIITMTGESK